MHPPTLKLPHDPPPSVPYSPVELSRLTYNDKYVIVYNFRNVDHDTAISEFTALLSDVESVGLHTEVRAGYDQTLLVFVKAPRELLGNAVYQARVKDWLYGVTKTHPGGTKDTVVEAEFEAEALLPLMHLVNHSKELGGASITPGFGKWENVTAIFCLHNDEANQKLLAHLSRRFFLQMTDLDQIRDLFGAKVAFYFAFLQIYIVFLIFISVAGFLAWAFLREYSLLFALVTGVWSTVFLEYWKLREEDYAIRWKVKGVGGVKVNRPNFRPEETAVDETGRVVHSFPKWKQVTRQMLAVPFVLLSVLVLGFLIAAVFGIEIYISEAYNGPYKAWLEYLPTVLLAAVLPYISSFLETIASAMTEYENYRTQDSYEMSLTQKIFVLNFITNYLPIFLAAFVYVPFGSTIVPRIQAILHRLAGHALEETMSFESDPDRLRNEVIAMVVTGQVSSLCEELVIPYIKTQFKNWYRDYRTSRNMKLRSKTMDFANVIYDEPEERTFLRQVRRQTILEPYDVQEDISQMVIQFGYLALFSPVWPLVPIGFLINNWFELRSDFLKICIEHQRPAPTRTDGIGPWINSLEALTWMGSISSAAVVHLFGTYTLGYSSGMRSWYFLPITIFISEHVFLLLRAGVRYALRKVSSHHIRKERNERYLERKKHLDELERSKTRTAHLEIGERERRKSVRMMGLDLFWTRQVNEGESVQAGVELIDMFKNTEGKKAK